MRHGLILLAAGALIAVVLLHHWRAPARPALGSEAACAAYAGLPPGWPADDTAGMAAIPGGVVTPGDARGYAEERGGRRTRIASFLIDATEVTNAQFAAFVAATGHVTDAELRQGSVIFDQPHDATAGAVPANSWWRLQAGADWRHPDGRGSDLTGRAAEPVVHVTRRDAEAYADWLGHRLPSEAEWEYAALAGRRHDQADADLRDAGGHHQANVWQGVFPFRAVAEDGHAGRAPVGCYAANPYGLHDMIGNVWEWTASLYDEPAGPFGPARRHPDQGVIKGGSYLCASNYCARARSAARQGQELDLPAGHIGFRTVR